MSSVLSKRAISNAFELTVETSRIVEEAEMIKVALEEAREIVDVDPQGAQDILREHLPPWLRREAEGRLN